ncbi:MULTISPECIES: acetyl-CoA C-acyltransferase family protein [unclassified Sphingobium]|uniref:acetyl-CoA C-acyltransferase family protein n=1 Tax=unclassified Sphingobium TaxID=2611147 RepID=UPI000D15CC52|nr:MULTISPECIES: acetyl-CoA C-acyltransferase family protein [unclassified Sphingobium]MBG6119958.1 acetyl-CoA C-acetyltransferase [Sphingobium sp. JAI105]PSO11875.1 acetyl-CoA C-acyltransferase [Sphingobium sp. AEW4]TWC99603.1 acetyl-CoA acetyltransferase /3-ketoacyl-CoA thiolase [Sphingobium sp. AEW010]TWD18960.1 acetyl-CoA acetyltransferase /3-ketoacyl-CoA thiolase [Sphingobium sp. AEW013]TWD21831.1 acetyl-CoA acetyltransferase /3-ketoacyl-CoA thiolase [Sphingobium sp. AEW001]
MTDIFLVSAARTAIGSFGGALKDQKPGELAAHVARAAIDRAGIDAALVGNVVLGNVVHTEPRDAYAARIAAIGAGIPQEVPAHTVNRLCGSGLQAIITAAQSIMLGDCDIALGAGVEVMSRAPYFLPAARWGQKMGDAVVQDGLTGALTDPFQSIHMGVTAENVAARHGISREDQDALALESQRRAAHAIAQGYFRDQIVPVEIMVKRKPVAFDTDEFVRGETSAEELAKLRPVFKREDGTVTAGNASGINDGAAAVVLASAKAVQAHGLTPLARLVSYGHAGVDPAYMGIGPVPATRNALARAGLSVADLDVIESNEAFAAQACTVSRELGFDPAKVNPNGSGISLGHPIGGTGAIIVTKLVHELQRTGGRYGLTTMCIGGGQGIAAIWERA